MYLSISITINSMSSIMIEFKSAGLYVWDKFELETEYLYDGETNYVSIIEYCYNLLQTYIKK